MSEKFVTLVVGTFVCLLLLLVARTSSQAISCVQHNDCLLNQFCERSTTYTCQPCKDCSPYWRYNGYSSCVQNILSDCGPCQDGYHEVEHYFLGDRVETCAPNKAHHETQTTVTLLLVTFLLVKFIYLLVENC